VHHYSRVRVLGASGYRPEAHHRQRATTYDLIVERGEQDKASEIGRFPRRSSPSSRCRRADLADHHFSGRHVDLLGKLECKLIQLAAATPRATTVAWLPEQKILFSATWSSSTPRRTPATPTSATGRRRSTTSPHCSRARWCPAAAWH